LLSNLLRMGYLTYTWRLPVIHTLMIITQTKMLLFLLERYRKQQLCELFIFLTWKLKLASFSYIKMLHNDWCACFIIYWRVFAFIIELIVIGFVYHFMKLRGFDYYICRLCCRPLVIGRVLTGSATSLLLLMKHWYMFHWYVVRRLWLSVIILILYVIHKCGGKCDPQSSETNI
jgi:hypothetical protein